METANKVHRTWRGAVVWKEIIVRYERSGDSARIFCAREGLSECTFWKWRNRFRGSELLPVEEKRFGKKARGCVGFVELGESGGKAAELSDIGQRGSYVELSFPGGLMLRVRG